MVVIAIIGILAGIVLVSLSAAKSRGNDAKRKSDLKNLALALSQYYNDNGSYPSTGGSGNWVNTGNAALNTALTPYMNVSALPKDQPPGQYYYISDGQSYKLFDLDPSNTFISSTQSSDEFYDPVNHGTNGHWAWMVCSGATACNTWGS